MPVHGISKSLNISLRQYQTNVLEKPLKSIKVLLWLPQDRERLFWTGLNQEEEDSITYPVHTKELAMQWMNQIKYL